MEIHDIKDGDHYVFGRMYRLYARTRRSSAREKAYANHWVVPGALETFDLDVDKVAVQEYRRVYLSLAKPRAAESWR